MMMKLFNGCSMVSGTMTQLPALQNEKQGKYEIVLRVRAKEKTYAFIWRGHKLPPSEAETIRWVEKRLNRSSGIPKELF